VQTHENIFYQGLVFSFFEKSFVTVSKNNGFSFFDMILTFFSEIPFFS